MPADSTDPDNKPQPRPEPQGGDSGGPGGNKPTAIGTGDNGGFGHRWQALLSALTSTADPPKVIALTAVSPDRELLAKFAPDDIDVDSVGTWSLGLHFNTLSACRRIGHNHVHQIVARTSAGYIIFCEFEGALLAILTDQGTTTTLIKLMAKVSKFLSA